MAWGKTECPITRGQFNRLANPLVIKFEGNEPLQASPTEFSTGSLGWMLNGKKITAMIGGVEVKVQVNCNLIIANSKDLPKESVPSPKMDRVSP